MEDTLRALPSIWNDKEISSLNPCFNGRYSQSVRKEKQDAPKAKVLILVLMEDTLRVKNNDTTTLELLSLNPCFNGRYSQSAKTCVPLFIVV